MKIGGTHRTRQKGGRVKTKIVICPTLRRAFYEWQRLANTYPDMWTNICKNPMCLTSTTGTKYIFHLEDELNKLRGCHADFISIDEFEMNIESEETDAEHSAI